MARTFERVEIRERAMSRAPRLKPREPEANLIEQVRELTGISDEALARKLGVPVSQLRRQRAGRAPLSSKGRDILARVMETSRRQSIGADRVKAPHFPDGIVCADSIEYVRRLPAASVDMILSDIPYGIGLEDWDVLHDNTNSAYMGQSAAQGRAGAVFKRRRKPINGWSSADRNIPLEYYQWCSSWASEWLRVLKPGGAAMVFAGRRLAARCVVALEDAGFNLRDLLGWRRTRGVLRAQRLSVVFQRRGELAEAAAWRGWRVGNLRPTFEPIIWCFKPYRVTIADNVLDHGVGAWNLERFEAHTGGVDNVIEASFEPGEAGLVEAQKPVKLMRVLIELCTRPGSLVLDPFAGSGTTALAAQQTARRCLAIERDPELCRLAERRLSESTATVQG
ncbi:MAG TPA: DNA methyltransferase [Polyangiaceae bacterium]|nr:DNA methyltransferase [Polyangiaceae bacterium]